MVAVKPERPFLVVTDETTREELAETLALLCEPAKAITRKGRAFQISSDYYRQQHARINAVLDELDDKP